VEKSRIGQQAHLPPLYPMDIGSQPRALNEYNNGVSEQINKREEIHNLVDEEERLLNFQKEQYGVGLSKRNQHSILNHEITISNAGHLDQIDIYNRKLSHNHNLRKQIEEKRNKLRINNNIYNDTVIPVTQNDAEQTSKYTARRDRRL
jgi:hypothetical protein